MTISIATSSDFHLVIQTNSPGELSAWVQPLVASFKERCPYGYVTLCLVPCQYASGYEYNVAVDIEGINELLKEDIKQYGMLLEQIVYKSVGNKLNTAEDHYDAGVKYMEFGRFKEAIQMLETAVNLKPDFPDAINTLGVCYTKKENYIKSIEYYEKAIDLVGGEHAGYMLNIAISHFMMGNKGMARKKYDEVVMVDPVFAGKLDKVFGAAKSSLATTAYEGQLEISAEIESELASGSSQGLIQAKNVEDKKIDLKEIPKVSHLKIRARSDNTVGVTFARLGNYSMAIDYFKKAVQNDPENVDFKANLAVAYYRTYKYDDAVRYYDQVKKKKPEMVSQLDFIESRGERTPKYIKFD